MAGQQGGRQRSQLFFCLRAAARPPAGQRAQKEKSPWCLARPASRFGAVARAAQSWHAPSSNTSNAIRKKRQRRRPPPAEAQHEGATRAAGYNQGYRSETEIAKSTCACTAGVDRERQRTRSDHGEQAARAPRDTEAMKICSSATRHATQRLQSSVDRFH